MGKRITIKKSKINKKGVFAICDFKKGEVVLKWNPKIISKNKADSLSKKDKPYLFIEHKKYYLMQSPEKYVNHSCDPNTKAINLCDVAIRDIAKGEEITSYYLEKNSNDFICNCGSKNCSRLIK